MHIHTEQKPSVQFAIGSLNIYTRKHSLAFLSNNLYKHTHTHTHTRKHSFTAVAIVFAHSRFLHTQTVLHGGCFLECESQLVPARCTGGIVLAVEFASQTKQSTQSGKVLLAPLHTDRELWTLYVHWTGYGKRAQRLNIPPPNALHGGLCSGFVRFAGLSVSNAERNILSRSKFTVRKPRFVEVGVDAERAFLEHFTQNFV